MTLRTPTHLLISVLALGLAAMVPRAMAGNDGLDAGAGVVARSTLTHRGDTLGDLAPRETPMHIAVVLKLRHRDRMERAIANLSLHGESLSQPDLETNYLPTVEQANSVVHYLAAMGFDHIQASSNRLLVEADGTADTVRGAFLAPIVVARGHDGRHGLANRTDALIPSALSDRVLAVTGLQTLYQAHTHRVRGITAGARTASTGAASTGAASTPGVNGHNPTEFSAIYGGSGVANASGVAIGIVSQGRLNQTLADLGTFTRNNGLAPVATQVVNTHGTSLDTSGVSEWDIDSQDIVGAAGGAVGQLVFYNIPTLSNTNLVADLNTIVTLNSVKIINVSLGECETDAKNDGSAAAADQIFLVAEGQGQTFAVSTGDSGADECGTGGTTPSWPADSPHVVAVAGTTLSTSGTSWSNEIVWNDRAVGSGATGGSQSTFEPKPNWQAGLYSGGLRGVADIAFDASPYSGALVIVNGSLQQWGGTSLAAPIFSGLWARVIAARGTGIGFAAPWLYRLPSGDLHDVTVGNNNGSTAAVGYDLATGRGSFLLGNALTHIGAADAPPIAHFSSVTQGLTASFNDSSTDSDGTVVAYAWSFGDGSTASVASPSHSYGAAGSYTVTETVTDNAGLTGSQTSIVAVSAPADAPPVANFGVTVSGLTASFADNSTDSDGTVVTHAWAFGDGATSSAANPSHSYGAAGSYTVTETVTDNAGLTGSKTVTVTVSAPADAPPVASFSFVVNSLTASFTDNSTDSDGTVVSYAWNFGDGIAATVASPNHTYAVAGTYTVTETVTDNAGLTASKTGAVVVTGSNQQLLGNPGFENGAANSMPWSASSLAVFNNNTTAEPAHSGAWDAWLGGRGLASSSSVTQTVAIPAGKTSAVLSYALHIDSAETTGTLANDVLRVKVFDALGNPVATLATYSNLNRATGYVVYTHSLAPWIGQTIRLRFVEAENSSLQTSFVLDDVAVNVQ